MESGYDRKKIKQVMQLILFGAAVVLALLYRKELIEAVSMVIGICKPFIYGGVIAFILNLPMNFVEKKLLKNCNGRIMKGLKRPLSMIASMLFVVVIIAVVISAVIPQLTQTVVELGNKIPVFVENTVVQLEAMTTDAPQLNDYIRQLEGIKIEWDKVFDYVVHFLKTGVSDMLASTVTVAGNIITGFLNIFIGIVFAIYILIDKEKLANQGSRILSAYFNDRHESRISKVLQLLYRNFSNFVTGQCIEAVVLGSMFIITMTILNLPYAVMLGVLIAFTALIPVVGALIGCFIGAFLILVDNPVQAVIFVIVFLILQQIEGNLIYPKVVGNKVGLPAIWVLFAVSIGGSLFGIAGMLFFIPLVSTIYTLFKDSVNYRNSMKNESHDTSDSQTDEDENNNEIEADDDSEVI